MNNIKTLAWDSDFFGFTIGQVHITNNDEAYEFENVFNNSSFDLVYVTVASELIQNKISDTFHVEPIENKRTYALTDLVAPIVTAQHEIVEINQVTESLVQLTFESGIESRFYKDLHFDKSAFEKLYRTWIEKSVNHELADHVYGVFISNQLAGFVTLSLKNDVTQIGLIAVDEEFRGKGIAKSLIAYCIMKTVQIGKGTIRIVTQAHNLAACSLYESIGFKEISSVPLFHIWKTIC